METTNNYDIRITARTLDHRGNLVHNAPYNLVEISQSGWALICQKNDTCHYVDPDSLRNTASPEIST